MSGAYGGAVYGSAAYAGPLVTGANPFHNFWAGTITEIAFTSNPLDDPAVWTDVSIYVQSITVNRGRQHELNRFEAGTVTVTLKNLDGRFSPFNGSSPYSPNVLPYKQIRIRSTWNGVVYPVFRGHIMAWPVKWPSPADSTVTVQAYDATKILNLKKPTSLSAYSTTVLADTPTRYWTLGDAPGLTVAADSSGNAASATVVSNATSAPSDKPAFFGAAGAIVASPDTAFDCGNSKGMIARGVQSESFGASFTVEAWVNLRQATGQIFEGRNASKTFAVSVNDGSNAATVSGTVQVSSDNSINIVTLNGLIPVADGKWHHIVVVSNSGVSITIYVDGAQDQTVATANTLGVSTLSVGWGGIPNIFNEGGTPSLNGVIDELAVYASTTLSSTQVANHYVAGALPRQAELSGARITALLAAVGWPTSLQTIDTGNSQLSALLPAVLSNPVLSTAQTVVDTEGGQLFVSASGQILSYSRYHSSASPNGLPAVTLGDNPLGNASSLRLPGTSGNYVSTPDSPAVSVGGNLLTVNQAGLETNTAGWSANSNCTIARSTAQFLDGAASLAITATAAADCYAGTNPTLAAVVAGQTYTAAFWSRAATVGRSINIFLSWLDASLSLVSQINVAVSNVTTGWTQSTISGVAPAGAVWAIVQPYVVTPGAGEVHYVDRISLTLGTGDIDVRIKVSLDNWAPASPVDLMVKDNFVAGQRSWYFLLNTTGTLLLGFSVDGTAVSFAGSTSIVGFANGTAGWVRCTRVAATGVVDFLKSTDGVTWTSLTGGASTAGALFDNTASLQLPNPNFELFTGNVMYAEVRNGIGGTVVASFDATKVTPSTATSPNFYTNLTTSEVWTVNGAGWSWVTNSLESPYSLGSVDIAFDDLDLWNETVITPAGLGPQLYGDTSSQTTYGKRSLSKSTVDYSTATALGHAQADTNRYKTPLQRVRSVSFTPMSDPEVLFPAALGFELLTRIRFKRRPKDGAGSTFTQDSLIEGIEHVITPGAWTTTWRLSPTDAAPVFWLIEDPVAGAIVENAAVGIGY